MGRRQTDHAGPAHRRWLAAHKLGAGGRGPLQYLDSEAEARVVEPRISYTPTAAGGSIAYSLLGRDRPGTPKIVIDCGLLLGCYQLQLQRPEPLAFLERLSQHAQVLIFDPSGIGLSGGTPRRWGAHEPGDLDAVTDAVGWDEYSVFGGFIEGPRVIAHAVRRPSRVRDLILWCSLSSLEMFRETRTGAALLGLAALDPRLFLHTLSHVVAGWSDHEGARWLVDLHDHAPGFDRDQLIDDLMSTSAGELMDQVKARTLAVFRRDSELINLDHARELVQRIPSAQLTLIDGESLIPYGLPVEPLVDTILEFLRGDPEAAPAESSDAPSGRELAAALGLTARQVEVLRCLAGGRTNREIALELGISVHTVDRHISMIYRRIGARGRADATSYAIRNSLLE